MCPWFNSKRYHCWTAYRQSFFVFLFFLIALPFASSPQKVEKTQCYCIYFFVLLPFRIVIPMYGLFLCPFVHTTMQMWTQSRIINQHPVFFLFLVRIIQPSSPPLQGLLPIKTQALIPLKRQVLIPSVPLKIPLSPFPTSSFFPPS